MENQREEALLARHQDSELDVVDVGVDALAHAYADAHHERAHAHEHQHEHASGQRHVEISHTHGPAASTADGAASSGLGAAIASLASRSLAKFSSKGGGEADADDVPRQRWMESLSEHLERKRIFDICLPGSHNSAAYALQDTFAPDVKAEIMAVATCCCGVCEPLVYQVGRKWAE